MSANLGADTCRSASAGGALSSLPLPLPLEVNAISASTLLNNATSAVSEQSVAAAGGIADVRLKALPSLPIALPEVPVPSNLSAVPVPLSSIPDPLNLLPDSLSLDLTQAVNDLLPTRQLPNVDILRVQAAMAYATGRCENGVPRVAGASRVAGITLLGKELPTNEIAEQTVSLIDTENIDLSKLDLSKVGGLDLGLLQLPLVGQQVQAAIQGTLDKLPPISIPATLARVKVTPGSQTMENGMLVQRALRAEVSIAGIPLADVAIGDARAGVGDVVCAQAAEAPACAKRRLSLIDVIPNGDRVKLYGAADKALAGQTVDIVFDASNEVVTKAKVNRDGSFTSTAPMPAKKLRATNLARYRAILGKEESLNLKLLRRMVVEDMSSRNGKVTIVGRVVRPLANPVEAITISRQVTCTKKEVVGRVMPKSDGSFVAVVDAPKGLNEAVYRLETRVRKTRSNPKTFPTYTLPRAVLLK